MAITVAHCELHEGSGSNTFEARSGSAVRMLLCDYEDADTLCSQAMGSMIASGNVIFWSPPAQHPRRSYLYVKRAEYEPLGTPGLNGNGVATWTKAKVRLEYGTLERSEEEVQNNPNQIYITERRSSAAEGLTLDKGKWKWNAGPDSGKLLEESQQVGVQIIVPTVNVSYTINNWPNAPVDTFDEELGKINKFDFQILAKTWPDKTLLYASNDYGRSWTSDGVTAWTVTLNFIYKKNTWLKFYHQGSGAWHPVVTDSGGTEPYEELDFSGTLFP